MSNVHKLNVYTQQNTFVFLKYTTNIYIFLHSKLLFFVAFYYSCVDKKLNNQWLEPHRISFDSNVISAYQKPVQFFASNDLIVTNSTTVNYAEKSWK